MPARPNVVAEDAAPDLKASPPTLVSARAERLLAHVVRIGMLTVVLWVMFRAPMPGVRAVDMMEDLLPWSGRAFVAATVLSLVILRSRWSGWRLVGLVVALFFGVTSLSLLDAAVFVPEVVSATVFIKAFVVSVAFAVLAVVVHGRWRDMSQAAVSRASRPRPSGWLWKVPVLALTYVVLYVLFGLLVFTPLAAALAPEVLEVYADQEMPAWILGFQLLRGLLFVLLGWPVLRATQGGTKAGGVLVGLAFGGLMAADLLIPTELIPPAMRAAHIAEVFAENLLFGLLIAWTLRPTTASPEASSMVRRRR